MKENQSFRRRIIECGITIFLIILVFVLLTTSYAWFGANQIANSTKANITVVGVDNLLCQKIQIYKRDGKDGAKDVSDNDNIQLTEYDTVFTDYNVNTPLLLRIEMMGMPKDKDGNYLDIDFTASYDAINFPVWLDDNGLLKPLISNIVDIRIIFADSDLASIDEDDAEATYLAGVEALKSADSQSFVSFNGNTPKKEETLYFSIEDYGDAVQYDSETEKDILVIFIEINYNDDLVQKYIEQHSIVIETSHDKDTIDFDNDLRNFTFEGAVKDE